MNRVLFATDTCKEAVRFMETLGNMIYENQIPFDFDKHRMIIKTNDCLIAFVPETSGHMGLYQVHPFDYYAFYGEANWEWTNWHKKCISRTKIDAKQIDSWGEIIKLIKGESE